MTREELNRLISLGEGQTLEFKRSASEDLGREMAAFANSIGGMILIGICADNKRKPRLMEILDSLAGKSIVEG